MNIYNKVNIYSSAQILSSHTITKICNVFVLFSEIIVLVLINFVFLN